MHTVNDIGRFVPEAKQMGRWDLLLDVPHHRHAVVVVVVFTVRRAQREGAWDSCPLNGHLPGHPQPSNRATPHSPCRCHHMGSAAWASPNN